MPPKRPRQPEIPEGQWAITKEDKIAILELGRELHKWLQAKFAGEGTKHIKIVAGSFQYVMDLQSAKAKAVGDDFVIAQEAIGKFNLGDKINEPFAEVLEPEEAPETKEQHRERLEKELKLLDQEEEIEGASVPPSAGTLPPVPSDGPKNA